MVTSIYSIIGVLIASVLGAFGALYLKKGADRLKFNFWKILKNYYLIGGIICYGLSTLIFIPSLKYGELSILYPLVSVGYIWVIILSIIYLKEKMNTYKWLGIMSIIFGVILIGFGS